VPVMFDLERKEATGLVDVFRASLWGSTQSELETRRPELEERAVFVLAKRAA
jgi:hypothetical protein